MYVLGKSKLCIGIIAFVLLAYCSLYVFARSAVEYHIVSDSLLSESAESEIQNYCKNYPIKNITSFISDCKKHFPVIDTVSIRYFSDGCAQIFFTAQKPSLLVNETMVVTANSSIIHRSFFKDENIMRCLPNIMVEDDIEYCDDVSSFLAFASKLPSDFFNSYQLYWKNKNSISFTLKNRKDCVILWRADLPVCIDTLKLAEKLFERAKDTDRNMLKKKMCWIADARFDHQIILYKEKRGA